MINIDTLTITQEMLKGIATVDEFKGAWQALGRMTPDRLSVLRKVATIESIGSSTRIEGSHLSDRDVENLLQNLDIRHFETRDEQEVAGYAEVMNIVFSSHQDISFSENHIKQLHQILLQYSRKYDRHRGQYKTSENNVVAFDADGKEVGVVFKTASAFDTPHYMTTLIDWTNSAIKSQQIHSLVIVAVFTVVFLEIHPFKDGNGRLSRILTTLLLLKLGYDYVPYSSMESIIEINKEAYYLALRQTQKTIRTETPDWQPWVTFFVATLVEQVRRLRKKAEQEKVIVATLPELQVKILVFIKEHGQITMAQAVKLTNTSRNTLRQHFKKLVENQHIRSHGKGRGVWYELET